MILSCTQLILNMLVSQLSVSGVVGPSELLGGGGGQTCEAGLGHSVVKLFSKLE